MSKPEVLLEVKELQKYFFRTKGFLKRVVGTVKAVDKINFFINKGETLALVGESGCGKTTTGRCVMRAIEPTSGKILFNMNGNGTPINLADLDPTELTEMRKQMAMIFQDPYSSLNPRMTVMEIVGESYIIHGMVNRQRDLEERVSELLRMVRLDPEYMRRYPHAFSGGQRQRITIARELYKDTKLLILDEATSSLDSKSEKHIYENLKQFKGAKTMLVIAHRLSTIKNADYIYVLDDGRIVEEGRFEELIRRKGDFKKMIDDQKLIEINEVKI